MPVRIWLANTSHCQPVDESDGLLHFSDSERRRFERLRSPRRKREFVAGRLLIRLALDEYFGIQSAQWQLNEQDGGPPLIANAPDSYYSSLSHSNGMVCYAIARQPVGVDIEANDRQRDFLPMANTVCDDRELAQLTNSPNIGVDFYRFWCAKEAWYKTLTRDEQTRASLSSLSYFDIFNADSDFTLWEHRLPGYQLSAVCKANQSDFVVTRVAGSVTKHFLKTMNSSASH